MKKILRKKYVYIYYKLYYFIKLLKELLYYFVKLLKETPSKNLH